MRGWAFHAISGARGTSELKTEKKQKDHTLHGISTYPTFRKVKSHLQKCLFWGDMSVPSFSGGSFFGGVFHNMKFPTGVLENI